MKARIDKFGRLVIPQLLREKIFVTAGSEVEIEEDDGQLTIRPTVEPAVVTREATGILVLHAEPTIEVDPVELLRNQRMRQVRGA